MRPLVPFGKYILLERISVGGMAEVYKAKVIGGETYDPMLAIKRILPSIAEDAEFIQMFIDEARIAGQLHHPHIAQIFELGSVDKSHFIAMEYVWGKDLLQIQNRFRKMKAKMPFAMAAFCAMKICEALDYAHKKTGTDGVSLGIIHRDVSPQNVLVSYEGDVKVIDFGIAKAAARSTKTQAGVLKGKFGYMSPEQVSGQPVDRRSDVFAIGTVLFELITADRLFLGESDFATLEKVRNVDVPLPSVAAPGCPSELERIILKGLSRDVELRYAWASDMERDLRAWLASLPEAFSPRALADWMQDHFAVERKREAQGLTEQLQAFEDLRRGIVPAAGLAMPVLASFPGGDDPAEPGQGRGNEIPGEPTQIISGGQVAAASLAGRSGAVDDAGAADRRSDGREHSGGSAAAGVGGSNGSARDREGTLAGLGGLEAPGAATGDAHRADSGAAAAGGVAQSHAGHAGGHAGGSVDSWSTSAPGPALVSVTEGAHHANLSPSLLGLPVAATSSLPGIPGAGADDAEDEMPSQATKIVDTSFMRPPAPPLQIVAPASQLAVHPPTSHVRMPPSGAFRVQRSTLTRDLLLGLTIAAILVGVVVGARMYTVSATLGTLVVHAVPAVSATVLIDGVEKGHVSAGRVLTLKGVSVGGHVVRVSAEAGEFEEMVTLAPGDVSVVSAVLRARNGAGAIGIGAGSPSMGGVLGEVDGDHDVLPGAIGGSATDPFATAVNRRDGGVLPSRLIVRTTPPGAEVNVNGRPAGLSPVDASDLQPDGLIRVTVRKRGYATAIRYLNYDAVNRNQSLDITLLEVDPGSEKSGADKAQPGKPDKSESASGKAQNKDPKSSGKSSDEKGGGKNQKTAAGSTSTNGGAGSASSTTAGGAATKKDEPGASTGSAASAPGQGGSSTSAGNTGAAAKTANGFLVANSKPSARVLVDGKDTGHITPIPPNAKLSLPPGKHVVTFALKGKKWDFDIDVKSGEDFKLIKTLAN